MELTLKSAGYKKEIRVGKLAEATKLSCVWSDRKKAKRVIDLPKL